MIAVKQLRFHPSTLLQATLNRAVALEETMQNEIYLKEDSMGRTSSKRRDSKDRVLEKGEYQKESGVYEYRYKDIHGKTRSIYSCV